MKATFITQITLILAVSSFPFHAFAACDALVGKIIETKLAPEVANADCPIKGLDKKGHKLKGVCYESTGAQSSITVDANLNCHASSESVVGKLFGKKSRPSASENLKVEAVARGSDCQLESVKVKPSGEIGKLFAHLFDANGRARKALQQGLDEACKGGT
jgi:hypothetical protein